MFGFCRISINIFDCFLATVLIKHFGVENFLYYIKDTSLNISDSKFVLIWTRPGPSSRKGNMQILFIKSVKQYKNICLKSDNPQLMVVAIPGSPYCPKTGVNAV